MCFPSERIEGALVVAGIVAAEPPGTEPLGLRVCGCAAFWAPLLVDVF